MELFFLKILDCMLGTAKGIFMNKNKVLVSALISAAATFFSLMMIVKIIKVNSISGMVIISMATFFGTCIPMYIAQRLEKDKIFVYNVTPDTNENGKTFADEIRENNISILTYKGYNKSMEPVLCSKIFSQSRIESRLIEDLMPDNFEYHVIEAKSMAA